MSEGKKKTLSLSRPGKLELEKTVGSGQVRQKFSHGRSKMVTVEVRKKRTYAPDSGGHMAEIKRDSEAALVALAPAEGVSDSLSQADSSGLTTEERATRARALLDAAIPEAAEDAVEIPPPAPEDLSEAEEAAPEAEMEAPEDEAAARLREAEEEEKRKQELAKASQLQDPEEAAKGREKKSHVSAKRLARAEARRAPSPTRRMETRRRSGKLTMDEALGNREERTRSLSSIRRAREKERQKQKQMKASGEGLKIVRDVVIPESITVQDLANRMAERSADVIRALMKMDVMASADQEIDADTAELVVVEFGHNVKRVREADVEIGLKGGDDDEASLVARSPVVTVMGHVDHGKTSLLDAVRSTDVAAGEAGGITQHIGAYQVPTPAGGWITFIDTPGHEAFTAMRARGARITDIVVLVVAADDGIMTQTIEAIDHAKAAEVPIIVAINKIDRPDADPGRVRTELLKHDLVVEEMGGEVLTVEVSAKEKTNLDKLLEAIHLQAELLDLKANPDRLAEGSIIETKVERGRGTVVTVLVQRGTLKTGDILVAGSESGRVRALTDSNGNPLDEAGPAMPVEVLGLTGTPAAGEDVVVVEDEARARQVAEFRRRQRRDARTAATRSTLEQMFEEIREGKASELPVVIKADVHGSVEAIIGALGAMGTDEVRTNVLHSGIGGINESDVGLAGASGALVIGFNVRASRQARDLAKREGVEIRYYSVIYNVTDDIRKVMSGLLAPAIREHVLGNAEIRQVFNITKTGKVAGCMVTEGMVKRGAKVRLLRDDVVIHEGSLSQLRRFKDDVKEVKVGTECGMAFENYQDVKEGDSIECYEIEEVAREL
ncbi:MAG: translation initiation factor IF-2 [Proteobacteria bacterium]|nr:translation initiation factor IF-2 [Pseudomonadota bacterium]